MRWLIAAFVLLAVVEPAWGDAASRCVDAKVDARVRIIACTRAVDATPTAQAYIDRARAYGDAMRWEDAQADLDKALALDPKHAGALAMHAEMNDINTSGGATDEIDKAIAASADADLYVERGDVHSFVNDRSAIADYTKALALDPKNVAALQRRAEAHARLDQHALARDDYNRALVIDPRNPDLYVGRGRIYREHLMLTPAINDFTAAIKLAPNNLDAYRERAHANARQAAFAPAIADLNRVLAAKPKDADALRARRHAYLESGDSARAIADAEQIFAVAKYFYAEDYLERGIAYLRRGGDEAFARAERSFKQAAEFERGYDRGAVKFVRKLCAIFCGARKSRSIAALLLAAAPSRKIIDERRNIADADAYMGILALKRGDDAKAAAIFAEALTHSRESAVAYYGRGVVKHNAGDVEGAKDDFAASRDHHGEMQLLYARAGIKPVPALHGTVVEPVPDAPGPERDIAQCQRGDFAGVMLGLKLDFTNEIDACTRLIRANSAKQAKAKAYANRARWRDMKKDSDGAIEDYNTALTVDPGNVEALVAVGGRLTAQRKYEEAVAAFDRAVKADPKSFRALVGRCDANAGRGDLKAALADCDRAIVVSGETGLVPIRRASVFLRAGDNTRALRDYDMALRELARYGLPDDPVVRFGRGVALKRLGDTAGAETELKKARAQDPTIDRQFAEIGIKP